MVEPKIMCRQHLIGEYRELFTILGILKRGTSIKGYIDNDLIEPSSILSRYNEVREEMISRGYKPMKEFMFSVELFNHLPVEQYSHIIDKEYSKKILLSRCAECSKREEESKEKKWYEKSKEERAREERQSLNELKKELWDVGMVHN